MAETQQHAGRYNKHAHKIIVKIKYLYCTEATVPMKHKTDRALNVTVMIMLKGRRTETDALSKGV